MITVPDSCLTLTGTIDHAVALTGAGWKNAAIYGLSNGDCACGKGHNDSPSSRGKHPIERGWQKNPITDPDRARNDLQRYSYPINLGIVLGLQTTGDYVIAIDVDDEARRTALEEQYGPLPETAECASGRGTRLFYRLPAGAPRDRIKNITGIGGAPGVDMKAEGGQVVVAPSIHWSGRQYRWDRTGEVAELPAEWVLGVLQEPVIPAWVQAYTPSTMREDRRATRKGEKYLQAAVMGEASMISKLKQGMRNDALNRAAFRMFRIVRGIMQPDQQAYVMRELDRAATRAGLSRNEIAKTLQSAARAAETGPEWRLPERPLTNGYTNGATNGTANGVAYAPISEVPLSEPVAPEAISGVFATILPDIQLIMNTETGKPEACPSNVARLISEHPDWGGGPVLDRFIGRITWPGNPIPGPLQRIMRDGPDLMEADITAGHGWLLSLPRTMRIKVEIPSVRRGIQQAAAWSGFDSLQRRIAQLPPWDGVERLSRWLTIYAGVEDTPVSQLFGRRWMISAIARALVPGCIADGVLVLEGDQGIGKNRLVTSLFGDAPWVQSIGSYKIGQSIDADRIAGHCWVVHDDEMRSRKSEVDALKGWISRREDVYRVPYETDINPHKRRAILICSTNRRVYLEDESNRRFWPVRCGRIDWARAQRDSNQLLSEALVAYRTGETWTISPGDSLWSKIQDTQDERRSVDPLVNMVRTALDQLGTEVSVLDLHMKLEALGVRMEPLDRRMEMRLGSIMRGVGMNRTRLRVEGERTYVYTRVAPAPREVGTIGTSEDKQDELF